MAIPRTRRKKTFRDELSTRYWAYQKERFPQWQRYFERDKSDDGRPPVFLKSEEQRNIISDPDARDRDHTRLLALIPRAERHLWFRSMNSSQALAQSVLGNLAVFDQMFVLADMKDDEGESLFGAAVLQSDAFSMEHPVNFLGEIGPRITKVDGFISGEYRVAIECKFIESEVGSCSRPRLYRRRVGPPQRFDLAAIALGKRPVQKLRRLISALKRAL